MQRAACLLAFLHLLATCLATTTTTITATITSTSTTPSTTSTTAVPATTTTSTATPHHDLPRLLTRLEEKLETLSCDLLPLPTESRLWQGNETQELMLPVMVPGDCDDNENEENECEPVTSWEGNAEMQSGDILLVRIDDSKLVEQASATKQTTPAASSQATDERRAPETAVYQVTRPGHAHCDVTEGVLLDITPLVVDRKKIVTLYDKDLTEGINLLIVVSDKWGGQCVRLRVLVKSDNCGDNQDCSEKGVCFSNISMEGYECQCCPGYVGPHCEEKDACYPSPCLNKGICVDISQGHDGNIFQCLCPYGFAGKTCQEETNPCDSSPCLHGGSCSRNVTTKQFRCDCTEGWAGALCQHSTGCSSNPCQHGICVSEDAGFKCFCQPGFAGQACEYEYNECESSPCINGGTCMDHIDGFSCICGRGFTGKRCHVKIDLCDPNPCHDHHYCVDRGNNYSCECPKGFSGPECLIPSRASCTINPCQNGGTCWSSVTTFYCACHAGYTGKTCEAEMPDPLHPYQDEQIPAATLHLDHLHNLYIAAGTLLCALIIVLLTVTACHCRVHESYKRCFINSTPLLPCKATRRDEAPQTNSNRLCPAALDNATNKACNPRGLTALDNSDMYYTLDFSDSQSSPLIQ